MNSDTLLPCPECGSEAVNGDDTTVTVEGDYVFSGRSSERTVAGKICPNCGNEFAL